MIGMLSLLRGRSCANTEILRRNETANATKCERNVGGIRIDVLRVIHGYSCR